MGIFQFLKSLFKRPPKPHPKVPDSKEVKTPDRNLKGALSPAMNGALGMLRDQESELEKVRSQLQFLRVSSMFIFAPELKIEEDHKWRAFVYYNIKGGFIKCQKSSKIWAWRDLDDDDLNFMGNIPWEKGLPPKVTLKMIVNSIEQSKRTRY